MPESVINESYTNLKTTGEEPGYLALDHYPFKPGMNFQVPDFPALAGEGGVELLGNNQAFFFVANPKGNTDPEKMELNTAQLEKLLKNIHEHNTDFTLRIDADVVENPERFVDKYQGLRGEPDEATRRALLGREAELIAEFVKSGGIRELAKKAIGEAEGLEDGIELNSKTADFLQHHFQLEGVRTQDALQNAVWLADGPEGQLLAKQVYAHNTHNTERPWQLGTQPELDALRETGHEGAASILDAVEAMRAMEKVNLTLGEGKGASRQHTFGYTR